MNPSIKVVSATNERTPEEAARAAPVSLGAGSYDGDALARDLDKASTAKTVEARDAAVDKAVATHVNTGTEAYSLDLQEGYKRVAVEVADLGITENRVVFDPKAAEVAAPAAPDAPANTAAADPAAK